MSLKKLKSEWDEMIFDIFFTEILYTLSEE